MGRKTHNSISTRSDWENYMKHSQPQRPDSLSHVEYLALDESERRKYNRKRSAWHSDLGIASTPSLRNCLDAFKQRAELNYFGNDPVAAHMAISGVPNLGKTTIARSLGRWYYRAYHTWEAEEGIEENEEQLRTPVVYISLSPDTSTRALNEQILYFLETSRSPRRRYSNPQIEHAAIEDLKRNEARLLILDDIHLLQPGRSNTKEIQGYLKSLTSKVPVMLLLVGIDLETTDIFEQKYASLEKSTNTAGQNGGRTTLAQVERYTAKSEAWVELIRWMEDRLVLTKHQNGTLALLSPYLWKRTKGRIGSLAVLIRLATLQAIRSEQEMIDEAILEGIKIDFNSENSSEEDGEDQ